MKLRGGVFRGGGKITRKPIVISLLVGMLLLGLISIRPTASAAETTNSVSIGFEYNFWDLDESVTISVLGLFDVGAGVESGFIFSMPGTISITTNSEFVSPTTQSVTVTLDTEKAHFQLNFTGDLTFGETYPFIDKGFNKEFNPLEPVHIEGVDVPLLWGLVAEMGVSIDLDIDAYVTADLYRGNTLLERLRWEDSEETKSFSYTIPEVSSTTTNTLSVQNIAWNYDLILDLSFYAAIDFPIVDRYSFDLFTIPFSLPSATKNVTDVASVSYTIRPPIPPEVSFTTLTSNATVSGTKTISASATDDKGVDRVEFWVDGVKKSTDYSSPYNWSWDTTNYSDGTHTVRVVAYDGDGKSDYQQYSVSVRNIEPPVAGEGIEPQISELLSNPIAIVLIIVGIIAAIAVAAKH